MLNTTVRGGGGQTGKKIKLGFNKKRGRKKEENYIK